MRRRTDPLAALKFTAADLEYIREEFVPLAELCIARGENLASVLAEIEAGRLPQPAYVLEDGTEMVSPDYFALADEAGGRDRLREVFVERYAAAAAAESAPLDGPDEEWRAYLSGDYGVCLRHISPETIARKSALVHEIDALLAEPAAADAFWRRRLRQAVDELDELERPFAPDYDRARWGEVSRDRLITAARHDYPSVFERAPV
jgi:Family of unknown function (DUF6058)